MELIFSEDFSSLENWNIHTISGAQSGNCEFQHYTDSPENVFVANNCLTLRMLHQKFQGYKYTSGKVFSKQAFGPYGFFNIQAKVPKGDGLFPAIWLFPQYPENQYGPCPSCGEIDIMESICTDPRGFCVTHFGGVNERASSFPEYPNNFYNYCIDWNVPHNFGVEWQRDYIQFWLDAEVVGGTIRGLKGPFVPKVWYSETPQGQRRHSEAPFDVPFNIVLNLAVGGSWAMQVSRCEEIPEKAEMHIFQVKYYK